MAASWNFQKSPRASGLADGTKPVQIGRKDGNQFIPINDQHSNGSSISVSPNVSPPASPISSLHSSVSKQQGLRKSDWTPAVTPGSASGTSSASSMRSAEPSSAAPGSVPQRSWVDPKRSPRLASSPLRPGPPPPSTSPPREALQSISPRPGTPSAAQGLPAAVLQSPRPAVARSPSPALLPAPAPAPASPPSPRPAPHSVVAPVPAPAQRSSGSGSGLGPLHPQSLSLGQLSPRRSPGRPLSPRISAEQLRSVSPRVVSPRPDPAAAPPEVFIPPAVVNSAIDRKKLELYQAVLSLENPTGSSPRSENEPRSKALIADISLFGHRVHELHEYYEAQTQQQPAVLLSPRGSNSAEATARRAMNPPGSLSRSSGSGVAGQTRRQGRSRALQMDHLAGLPTIVLVQVFAYLSMTELRTAAQVSRRWSDLVRDYLPQHRRRSVAVAAPTSPAVPLASAPAEAPVTWGANPGATPLLLLSWKTVPVTVRFADGSVWSSEVNAKWTVEQVKRDVFRSTPALYAVAPESLLLAVDRSQFLQDESALFVYSHQRITAQLAQRSPAHLLLLPKAMMKEKREALARPPARSEAPPLQALGGSRMVLTRSSPMLKPLLSPAASDLYNEPDLAGFLLKHTSAFKTDRRWCVLKNSYMFYFKAQHDEQPAGTIALQDCVAPCAPVLSKKGAFSVATRLRTYVFSASDAEELARWVTKLNETVRAGPQGMLTQRASPEFFSTFEKAGWLTKAAPMLENWKRRWFVLKERYLYYFKQPPGADASPLGVIALQDSLVEPDDGRAGRKNCFCVQTRHRRYHLCADTVRELRDWLEFIARSRSAAELPAPAASGPATTADRLSPLLLDPTRVALQPLASATTASAPPLALPDHQRRLFGLPETTGADRESALFREWVTAGWLSVQSSQPSASVIEAELVTDPLPPGLSPQFIAHFYRPDLTFSAVKCELSQAVEVAVRAALKKLAGPRGPQLAPEEVDLLVAGRAELIADLRVPFSSLLCVRSMLKRGEPVHFVMVPRQRQNTLPGAGEPRPAGPPLVPTRCYPSCALAQPLELRLAAASLRSEELLALGLVPAARGDDVLFCVEAELYFGNSAITPLVKTARALQPVWNSVLRFAISIAEIPREALLCFSVYAVTRKAEFPLGSAIISVFDFEGRLRTGAHELMLQLDGERANPLAGPTPTTDSAARLQVQFPVPDSLEPLPVLHALPAAAARPASSSQAPPADVQERINALLGLDPLHHLVPADRALLWEWREYVRSSQPLGVAKLVAAVDWTRAAQVAELHELLEQWPQVPARHALALLVPQFADQLIRATAVRWLSQLTDHQLCLYLLQLIHAVRHEPFHDSALARFLLLRALNNPLLVGHSLFWHLRANMHQEESRRRFGLLLEAYLAVCSSQREELALQVQLVDELTSVAEQIKATSPAERKPRLRELLSKIHVPARVRLPLNPRLVVSELLVDECRPMDSFTVPLWLVFRNADPVGRPVSLIFKVGDDLRQDVLTLQMLSVMDALWKADGFDLHLTTYGVLPTAEDAGMIEVVPNALTTAQIHTMHGGVTAAFSKTPLFSWLQQHNATDARLDACVSSFTLSLVGYCVATYILGIGDRHNDNIMVCKSGHLFHIDFGRFLGNVQMFGMWNRDRAPFVLTPEFVHVVQMGGKNAKLFDDFVNLCCVAFNTVRKHANLFFTLFSMMLSSGMAELRSEEDLDYLRRSFAVDLTEEEATKLFAQLVHQSLNTKSTQVNFAVHLLAKPK